MIYLRKNTFLPGADRSLLFQGEAGENKFPSLVKQRWKDNEPESLNLNDLATLYFIMLIPTYVYHLFTYSLELVDRQGHEDWNCLTCNNKYLY